MRRARRILGSLHKTRTLLYKGYVINTHAWPSELELEPHHFRGTVVSLQALTNDTVERDNHDSNMITEAM